MGIAKLKKSFSPNEPTTDPQWTPNPLYHCTTNAMLWHICYGSYAMAATLWQLCYDMAEAATLHRSDTTAAAIV